MSSSPLPGPRLPRRTATGLLALGALALGGAVAGCDAGALLERPRADPEPDADERLAASVVQAITAARAVAAARPHAGRSAAWVALHDAHLAMLGAASQDTTGRRPDAGPTTAPATPGPGRSVRATETALQRTLTDAAMRADSGALARTLAAMSAGVAQLLASEAR